MLGVSAGLSVFPSLARNKLQVFIMAEPGSAPPAQLSEDPQRLCPSWVLLSAPSQGAPLATTEQPWVLRENLSLLLEKYRPPPQFFKFLVSPTMS